MRIITLTAVILTLASLQVARASKILAMLTVPAHSHHIWSKVYLEALAAKGHEITYLGVDEYKNPPKNIRYIFLDHAYDLYTIMNFTVISNQNPYSSVIELDDWEDIIGDILSQQDGMKQLLDVVKKEKFDLVIFDSASTAFLLGVVDLLGKPPILGVTPFSIPAWAFDMAGSPYPIQYNSHMMLKYGKDMNYFERLNNAAIFLFSAGHRFLHLRNQEAISKRVFGPNVRHVSEIIDDINVNIVNGNWVTDNPFPSTPGFVPIAGVHIQPPKPLPKELKDYLDGAKDGVIFFSLGSNIQSVYLQEQELAALTEAFRQIAPVKVLWKYEKDVLPGKPDNVKIAKWLPQSDILAHPNVRLFFTHGGLLSTQEAYFHGKPIVGMPIFLDQHINVKKLCTKGIGESLKLEGLRADDIVKALRTVLETPSYKENAAAYSKIFRDQENTPMERAIYWTEYVIRHNGAKHLRPASKNMNWFQNGLYDIILTFLAVEILIAFVIYKVFKILRTMLRTDKKQKKA